jgi:hypothetical protein
MSQRHTSLQPSSEALLDSLSKLRRVVRRVWSATSESEILIAVTEATAEHFGDADFAGVFKRIQLGQWYYPVLIGGEEFTSALTEIHFRLNDGFNATQIDESMLQGVLTRPGQVGTRHELYPTLTVKDRLETVFADVGFRNANFLAAHIRSREDFEATIFANYIPGKHFSELERAMLGWLGDVASVALSAASH